MREEYPWLDKFSLSFLLDELIELPSFVAKRMFGGVAVYLYGRISILIMENRKDKDWSGVLIPSRRERHVEIQQALPSAIPHPTLGSWLYLPVDSDGFEDEAQRFVRFLRVDNPLYGVEKVLKKKDKKNKPADKLKKPKKHSRR